MDETPINFLVVGVVIVVVGGGGGGVAYPLPDLLLLYDVGVPLRIIM